MMSAVNPIMNQTVSLWLKSEPFAIGSLSSPPSPRLTVNVSYSFCIVLFSEYRSNLVELKTPAHGTAECVDVRVSEQTQTKQS